MKIETRERRKRDEFANEYEEWKEGRRQRVFISDLVVLFKHSDKLVKEGNIWVLRVDGVEFRNTTRRKCIKDWFVWLGYAIDKGKTFIGLALVNFKMRDAVSGNVNGDILIGDLLEAQEKDGRWWLVTKWTRNGVDLVLPEPEAWANDGNGANLQDVTPAVR